MESKKKISVVVPCFNEEEVISDTNQRLTETLQKITNYNYEIIYVDDGSKDNTLSILQKISLDFPNIKVISFSRNFGHQNAVSAGIHYSNGDCTVLIDADLQDPPEFIEEMLSYWENGYDVVYAVRQSREGETFFKLITAKLFYRFLRYLSEVNIPLDTGDFRLMDKKVTTVMSSLKEKNKFIRGLVAWVGFKQIGIPYQRSPRFKGETKYHLRKMVRFAMDGLLSFSQKPLRLALSLGFSTTAISFLLALYIIIASFLRPETIIKGWASTLVVILFLGGVQLVCIGILGEYIARIYDEVKDRPNFIVKKEININKKDE